jgi:hypothetical protein
MSNEYNLDLNLADGSKVLSKNWLVEGGGWASTERDHTECEEVTDGGCMVTKRLV